ncbi:unnamed protein product, partial [marine sediment metagenome]
YPPWRLRLRRSQNLIEVPSSDTFKADGRTSLDNKLIEKTLNKVNERFKLIKSITNTLEDERVIKNDPILKIAYKEIKKDIDEILESSNHFEQELRDFRTQSNTLFGNLPHLINRLDNGLPPNAFEFSIENREPASIVEIMNAAWFYKISWGEELFMSDNSFNVDLCNKREMLNRLTLKAIEYSDLEKEYRKYLEKTQK